MREACVSPRVDCLIGGLDSVMILLWQTNISRPSDTGSWQPHFKPVYMNFQDLGLALGSEAVVLLVAALCSLNKF